MNTVFFDNIKPKQFLDDSKFNHFKNLVTTVKQVLKVDSFQLSFFLYDFPTSNQRQMDHSGFINLSSRK